MNASINTSTASLSSARVPLTQTANSSPKPARAMRSVMRTARRCRVGGREHGREKLGYKFHYAIADYLQRSARHIASDVDVKQAYAVGKAAVQYALQGKTAVMPVIKRLSDKPYRWKIEVGSARQDREQGKETPGQLHQQRRLRHHKSRAPLPRTADQGRELPSIYQWFTESCEAQEQACEGADRHKICGMMRGQLRAGLAIYRVRERS